MKGMPGILIAAGLGIVGAFCNWFYVDSHKRNYEKVAFVAIKQGAQINLGDRLIIDHFEKVEIPKANVGGLDSVAVRWDQRETVAGYHATKSYRGGEILLHRDLETVAQQDLTDRLLGDNDVLFQVVVDQSTFVSEHYDPGDIVTFFLLPELLEPPAVSSGTSPDTLTATTTTVGDFSILALGGRKGKRETAAAYNRRSARENIVTIALVFPFDDKARGLFRLISASGGRGLRMIKHKPVDKSE